MEIKYISKLKWLFLQKKLVYPFSLSGVNIIENKHLTLNSFLKKEYHGVQAELALSMVLGWLWTPDPRASTFCTIIQAVLGTEPGFSALYRLSYIPCPKFYNVSSSVLSNTFKWAPKCTHLPLINKSKLSQVYNRSIQPGGVACLRSESTSISSVPQFHFAPTLNPGGVIVL